VSPHISHIPSYSTESSPELLCLTEKMGETQKKKVQIKERREECRQSKGWKGCVVDKWQKREKERIKQDRKNRVIQQTRSVTKDAF